MYWLCSNDSLDTETSHCVFSDEDLYLVILKIMMRLFMNETAIFGFIRTCHWKRSEEKIRAIWGYLTPEYLLIYFHQYSQLFWMWPYICVVKISALFHLAKFEVSLIAKTQIQWCFAMCFQGYYYWNKINRYIK